MPYFSARLDFPSPPLSAPGSPRIPLSGSNYNHAVDLLMKRFGSKQVIISKHIEMLMQLPKLNNSNDLKQLRQLLDKTEATTRSLQGIDVSSETYGTFLTPVIMAKIPQELRLILGRAMSDEWDLDTMLKSFAEELQIRERCVLGPVSEQTPKLGVNEKRDVGSGLRHDQIGGPPTPSTLFSNQEGPLPNKEMWCTFCNGPHPSNRCAVVTDSGTKKKNLLQKGGCFGRLMCDRISKDCSARCYRCGGKHHLSLCSMQKQPMQFRQPRGATQEQNVSTNLYFT